jgi:hypothetical protein
MQMKWNKELSSLTLGSAHEKFDVSLTLALGLRMRWFVAFFLQFYYSLLQHLQVQLTYKEISTYSYYLPNDAFPFRATGFSSREITRPAG